MVYPISEPFDEGFLQVDPNHKLYYFQCGNPEGKPVIFLHGGPGGGITKNDSRFFDPKVYRVIMFSQRGAWQSLPLANLVDNTTQHIIGEIEWIRRHFNIDRWLVFGGSWGTTLGLAYAQQYPERCIALVLRGIVYFNMEYKRRWASPYGVGMLFPEAWEEFVAFLPPDKRDDPLDNYYEYCFSSDPIVREAACRAWNKLDIALTALYPDAEQARKLDNEHWNLAHAQLRAQWFKHHAWLEDGQLIMKENIDKIRHIPCFGVHGRYDVIAPARNAWDLKKAWPEMELHWSCGAGHSVKEPETEAFLTLAMDKYKNLE